MKSLAEQVLHVFESEDNTDYLRNEICKVIRGDLSLKGHGGFLYGLEFEDDRDEAKFYRDVEPIKKLLREIINKL